MAERNVPGRAGDTPLPAGGPRLAVGVDLGGTNIHGLLVGSDGGAGAEILARCRRLTPADHSPDAVLGAVRDVAAELLEKAERLVTSTSSAGRAAPVAGLGLGIPGPVDPDRGVCLFSPNLGWRDFDVAGWFRRALDPDLPVRLDNDVRVATLGEGWAGAGRGYRTFICLTLGTGIGSGVILDGRLWRGAGSSAGEIGHIPVDTSPGAPLCGCGRRGCLEAVASGKAIAREAGWAVLEGEPSVLAEVAAQRGPAAITAHRVAEAARAGDTLAGRILERAATYLGLGIATAVTLFNPEAVVVGGGVAGAWDLLGPVVRRVVEERTFPPNLAALKGIFPAELGDDAGAVGAASLFLSPRKET